MINPFIRIPEGPQRVVAITQAFWSVLSGRTSWKVQAEVDRETQHLTFRDVLKHVWYIPAIAVLFLIGIYARGEPVHFLLWTLLIPWLFSPFTTWFGSRNISPGQRTGRFYRWLVKDVPGDRFNDDEKPESNRTESRRNGGTSSKTGGSWLKSEFYKKWMAAPLETLGLLAALQLIAKNAVEFIGLSGFEGALVVSLAVGILAPLIYFYGHWFRNPEAMRDPAVQRLAWLTLGAGLLAGLSLMAPQLFTLFMVGALWLTDDHFRLNGGTDGRIEALLRDVPLNLGVGENPSHRLARGALFAETVSNMADADGIMRIKESLVLAGFSVGGLFESAAALRSVFLPGASVHFVHTGVSDTDLKSLGEAYALLHPQGGDRMRFVVPDKATEIRLAKHVPASAIAVALGATFIENAGRTRVNLALVEKRLGTWLSGKQELTLFSTTPLELSLQGVTSRALREAAEVFRLLLEALNGLPPSAIIQLRMIDKVAGAIMRSA
jgi:hypothetical protein